MCLRRDVFEVRCVGGEVCWRRDVLIRMPNLVVSVGKERHISGHTHI